MTELLRFAASVKICVYHILSFASVCANAPRRRVRRGSAGAILFWFLLVCWVAGVCCVCGG